MHIRTAGGNHRQRVFMSRQVDNVTYIGKASEINKSLATDLLVVDPLQELLDEFSDLVDQVENPAVEEESLPDRENPDFSWNVPAHNPRDLLNLMQEQIKMLKENRLRIKFYLDEIENYLPTAPSVNKNPSKK
jgi:hypothetical protein